MTAVDTLVTRFTADTRDYERGADRVIQKTKTTKDEFDEAKKGIEGHGFVLLQAGQIAMRAAAAYAMLNAAIVAVGVAAYQKFGDYDALVKSLEAVEGSAADAAKAMRVLQDVAKLPGLGLIEAAEGFRGLRMQGLNQAQSERVIRAAGNANALSGGGREELTRILMAFRQILSRPNLSGEELNQLAEAGLPGHRILMDRFGTADGGELKRMGVDSREAFEALIEGLEKMPRAAGSAKNDIENFMMSLEMAVINVGKGVAASGLGSLFAGIAAGVEKLTESGGAALIGESIGRVIQSIVGPGGLTGAVLQLGGAAYAVTESIAAINNGLHAFGGFLSSVADHPLFKALALWYSNIGGAVGAVGPKALIGPFWAGLMDSFNLFQREFQTAVAAGGSMVQGATTFGTEGASLTDAEQASGQAAADLNSGYLAGIERNTREMVEVQRMILGGGNRGRFGVTAEDLTDLNRTPRGGAGSGSFTEWLRSGLKGNPNLAVG